MNELFFQIGSSAVLPAWLLLLCFPRYKHNKILIWLMIMLLAVGYVALMVASGASFDAKSFNSIGGIQALFANETVLTAGWLHYLAFDLWIGAAIVETGLRLQLPRWKFTLPLPFTFLFGPAGWLLFQLLKSNKNELHI